MLRAADYETSTSPLVEFLLLADRAEAMNGKLYVMGGGWERITTPGPGAAVTISFAVSILVPWNATNRDYSLVITILDADGQPIDFKVDGTLTTGRPPDAIQGQPQRVMLAMPSVPVAFPRGGRYEAIASINTTPMASVPFTVYFQPSPEAG
jgi:hypothetical protein